MNNGSFMNNINYKPYLWEIRKYPEYSTSSDVFDEDRLIHTGNFIIVDPKNLIGIPVMSTLNKTTLKHSWAYEWGTDGNYYHYIVISLLTKLPDERYFRLAGKLEDESLKTVILQTLADYLSTVNNAYAQIAKNYPVSAKDNSVESTHFFLKP